MRCPPFVFAGLLLCACKDAAKEKELAELRAKVAKMENPAPPSLSAAKNPEPAVAAPSPPPTEPEKPELTEKQKLGARVLEAMKNHEALMELYSESTQHNGKRLSYALIKKNPDRFFGVPWNFTGKIVEISEAKGVTLCRLTLDYYQNDVVFVMAIGETDFVENDIVDVLGILNGTYSYTSQAGWNITIPSMIATGLLKRGELAKLKKGLAAAKPAAAKRKTSEEEVEELTKD